MKLDLISVYGKCQSFLQNNELTKLAFRVKHNYQPLIYITLQILFNLTLNIYISIKNIQEKTNNTFILDSIAK